MKLSRRKVLGGGALLLGGGLVLRIAWPGKPEVWGYLDIGTDDVIRFVVARTDMGQGTTTMHAQALAEELEVPLSRMNIVLADADRRYAVMGAIQITGGSMSTAVSLEPYQRAGAAAREMLKAAAARTWDVPVSTLTVAGGVVSHAASGRSARYGELVELARTLPVPGVEPRRGDFKVIGQPAPRIDGHLKVTGQARYGVDVDLPGLLVGVLVRSPVPGGTVKSFDPAPARAIDGVTHVVQVPVGVAVVGRTYWHARKGAQALTVEWDEGPVATLDSEALLATHRRLLREPGGETMVDEGDALAALETPGATVVEAEYAFPYLAHATMEPQNATARIGADGTVEVWAPTQGPGVAQAWVASALEVPQDRVKVYQTWTGGGFGRRTVQDYAVEAALVSRALDGAPVKLMWSREDDMRHSPYRPAVTHRVRAAVDARGTILGWHHRVVSQSLVAQSIPGIVGAVVPSMPRGMQRTVEDWMVGFTGKKDPMAVDGLEIPYAVNAHRVEYVRHETGVPIASWRSVGNSHTAHANECFVDELAHAMKKDPVELRRALLAEHPRHRRVLDLVAEKSGWTTPPPEGVGRGVALHFSFNSYAAAVAEVRVDDGAIKVQRLVMALDCGLVVNPDIVRSQLESAAVYALSATLHGAITFKAGRVVESNFHDYAPLRLDECPVIETHLVPSTEKPTGVGEPGVPVIAPAVANAVFALTGQRIRDLPLRLPPVS